MAFLALVGVVALLVISSVLNGWVLSILWGWFFVPVLDLPQLSTIQAIGIAMVVSYLTYQHIESDSSKDDTTTALVKAFFMAIFRPLLTLLFAWIVHMFM